VVAAVASWEQRSMRERGYSPAKPKTERAARGIGLGLAFKSLARRMGGTCGAKGRQSWLW
jgi:hypothetical protein